MVHLRPLAVLGFSALVAACDQGLQEPDLEPVDTIQTRGTLLTSGESLEYGPLVWVPGTELVAFPSRTDTGGCAIKTVDAASGNTGVLDGECKSITTLHLWWRDRYFQMLVAAPTGNALYYSVGIGGGSLYADWVLRVADPVGGGTSTLRSGVVPALAVSPDARHVAYVVSDSLFVRDLQSGADRHYADYGQHEGRWAGTGGPITFSPDGTDLLYGKWVWDEGGLTLRRLSLDDGTSELVPLPSSYLFGDCARLIHWGTSGIQVLAEVSDEYRVDNLTTGASVRAGPIQRGLGEPYYEHPVGWGTAWSTDGTRVAYVIQRGWYGHSETRYAVFVADTRTGTRVRVAYTSIGASPTVLSPDGTRVVYHGSLPNSSYGDFYVVDVP